MPAGTSNATASSIRLADAVHETSDVSAMTCGRNWRGEFDDGQLLDLVMLCGWYHAISSVARVARVALEDDAPTFAAVR